MTKSPPKFALRFLEWFCPASLYESIEGDLLQQFEDDLQYRSTQSKRSNQYWERRARRRFIWNVLRFFHPEILLRNKFSINTKGTLMIRNYTLVASRNMLKHKFFTLINAFGLSIGIAFSVLIAFFIMDEQRFDQFHHNKDRIYGLRIVSYNPVMKDAAGTAGKSEDDFYLHSQYLPAPLTEAIKREVPGVEYVSMFDESQSIVQCEENIFREKIAYVDADFFKMFSFSLVAGNPDKIFTNPSSVVVTNQLASKLFGEKDPIGKTIKLNRQKEFIVSGVVEAPPSYSTLDFSLLALKETSSSFNNFKDEWQSYQFPAFIQVSKGTNIASLEKALDKVFKAGLGKEYFEGRRKDYQAGKDIDVESIQLTSLNDVHLDTRVPLHKASSPMYSLILGGITLLILLIASVNYISLTLTNSTRRKLEVGIRKVMGAGKKQVFYQFIFESMLVALISAFLGLILAWAFLPYFNLFTRKAITPAIEDIAKIGGITILFTILIAILAGSYPSLYLSAAKPITVLKNRLSNRLNSGIIKPLVVFQFAASVFLIIVSVVMYKQMKFINSKDLGFNSKAVIVLPAGADKIERFKNTLHGEPGIISIAAVTSSFAQGENISGFRINGEYKLYYRYGVDPNYLETLNIELKEGRNFTALDSNAVIVNEALARDLDWKNPLQEKLFDKHEVIGVVKDFHYQSLRNKIKPMYMELGKKYLWTMLVRTEPKDVMNTMNKLRQAWKDISPDSPFEYTFMDQDIANQYDTSLRWTSIMRISTIFAIIIACLGLFGLAGINAINRTKEISIRKIFGAELTTIFILLNRQYIKLIFIAFVLATPVSWYFIQQWLKKFEYKITVGWELFAISMLASAIIALGTVSYHGIKAALVNPAETLKHE